MIIYNNTEVAVEVGEYSASISVKGTPKPLYLTLPELAGIGEAIVTYLSQGPIGRDECEKRAEWALYDEKAPF